MKQFETKNLDSIFHIAREVSIERIFYVICFKQCHCGRILESSSTCIQDFELYLRGMDEGEQSNIEVDIIDYWIDELLVNTKILYSNIRTNFMINFAKMNHILVIFKNESKLFLVHFNFSRKMAFQFNHQPTGWQRDTIGST